MNIVQLSPKFNKKEFVKKYVQLKKFQLKKNPKKFRKFFFILPKKISVINFFDKNRKDFLPTKIFAKQNFTEIKIVEKKDLPI